MFKTIIISILVLIVVGVGLGFVLPDQSHLTRSVVIERKPPVVFAAVNSLYQFSLWSPWSKLDPEMKTVFSGPDAGKGAEMTWSSDDPNVGNGHQRIRESIKNKSVVIDLTFDDKESEAYFLLENPLGERGHLQTKLTWGFKVNHDGKIISRYMGLLMGLFVGRSYDQGLSELKKQLESAVEEVLGADGSVSESPTLDAKGEAGKVETTETLTESASEEVETSIKIIERDMPVEVEEEKEAFSHMKNGEIDPRLIPTEPPENM